MIPDIQETAKLMQRVVHEFHQQQASSNKEGEGGGKGPEEQVESLSAEERYLAKMRSLQFGECGPWAFRLVFRQGREINYYNQTVVRRVFIAFILSRFSH